MGLIGSAPTLLVLGIASLVKYLVTGCAREGAKSW